jgi:hypothetical protein
MQSDEVADVLQRPDSDERDLTPIPADRVGQKPDGRRSDRPVGLKILGPRELIVNAIGRNGRRLTPDGHGHIRAPEAMEQFACEPRPPWRVGIADGDPQQLERRALHRIPERPGVVDVGADVGVEHDLHAGLL